MATVPLAFNAPADPAHRGMGAVPYVGGVTFRVWSKFADSVSVVGDFNDWDGTATPMKQDDPGGDYWSVDVIGLAAGAAYRFCLPYKADPNRQPVRMDPYASSVVEDKSGNLNAVVASNQQSYDSGSYCTPQWKEAVIYELHIPSFTTAADGSNGTFATALTRLPDLVALGINAIEILPLGQYVGISDTGYNTGYIFAVQASYGGPDAFRDFVNQAHRLGLAVIVDVVYNHLGTTDLWDFNGWSPDHATCPWDQYSPSGGIYFFGDYRAHTTYSHARFDLGRPEVFHYVFDNAMRWLKDRFVDGLRFDSTVNIRAIQIGNGDWTPHIQVQEGKNLLRAINQEVQNSIGWKLTIAEDLQGDSNITDTLDNPDGLAFGAQWNDDFCYAVRNAAKAATDGARDMGHLARAIASGQGASAFKNVLYSENHDKDDEGQGGGRLPNIIGAGVSDTWNAKKQSTLAAAVVLTAPGIPMIFQGQEFLEYLPFPTDGPNPLPIHWGRKDQFAGIWNLYRDLIHLRRNWFNNTRGLQGQQVHVLPVFGDNMLVYHRYDQGGPGDDVIVVCNFSAQSYTSYAIGLPSGGMWRVRFNSDAGFYDAYFSGWNSFDTMADGGPLNGMPCSGNIGINAYTCLILSQD